MRARVERRAWMITAGVHVRRLGGVVAAACLTLAALLSASRTCMAADTSTTAPHGSWQLTDGDRVVMLGEGFIEREGQYGIIETALVGSHADLALEFRNLGWNGDTVWAESRGVFDSPAEGYKRLLSLVEEISPTVVIVAYGRNESYAGAAGLDAFREQLRQLCDDLTRASVPGETGEASAPVRLVLVTPPPFLAAPTCPDAETRNAALADYAAVIRDVASEREAGLVDLFASFPRAAGESPLSTDGLQLTPTGYEAAARIFVASSERTLPAEGFAALVGVRRLVAAKNELFFHRWRPANETYLFLFRRHEQGNNAVEIPQFDPLVEEAEAKVRTAAAAAVR